jgi:mannose-6-phosphate isomerase-like protein (cupin superfamily)
MRLRGVVIVTALVAVITAPARAQEPARPGDKAVHWSATEFQGIWSDLEAKEVILRRVLEGGSYSVNVRIVKEGDAPLVHADTVDVWLVQAGTATSITSGELVDAKKNPRTGDLSGSGIRGGIERPLRPGDVLFVPSGVPHGFKDVQGFRAFLIRLRPN